MQTIIVSFLPSMQYKNWELLKKQPDNKSSHFDLVIEVMGKWMPQWQKFYLRVQIITTYKI